MISDDGMLRLSAEAILDFEAIMNRSPQIIPELIDLMEKYGWNYNDNRGWGE